MATIQASASPIQHDGCGDAEGTRTRLVSHTSLESRFGARMVQRCTSRY